MSGQARFTPTIYVPFNRTLGWIRDVTGFRNRLQIYRHESFVLNANRIRQSGHIHSGTRQLQPGMLDDARPSVPLNSHAANAILLQFLPSAFVSIIFSPLPAFFFSPIISMTMNILFDYLRVGFCAPDKIHPSCVFDCQDCFLDFQNEPFEQVVKNKPFKMISNNTFFLHFLLFRNVVTKFSHFFFHWNFKFNGLLYFCLSDIF